MNGTVKAIIKAVRQLTAQSSSGLVGQFSCIAILTFARAESRLACAVSYPGQKAAGARHGTRGMSWLPSSVGLGQLLFLGHQCLNFVSLHSCQSRVLYDEFAGEFLSEYISTLFEWKFSLGPSDHGESSLLKRPPVEQSLPSETFWKIFIYFIRL